MEHQANQVITAAKLNGGAVCGCPQTVVLSWNWSQRREFLDALRKSIAEDTPAAGTYYPGSDDVKKTFMENHANAAVPSPEKGRFKSGEFVFIEDAGEDSFAVKNEAFCQIMNEVALDVPASAADFLPAATEFCNTKLLGTLGCMILIDEKTQKTHQVGQFDNSDIACFLSFKNCTSRNINISYRSLPFISMLRSFSGF